LIGDSDSELGDVCSVRQLLENVQQVAEHNNFFNPGFRPAEMDDIPQLYHRIIDDPALLHDRIATLHSQSTHCTVCLLCFK